jgi:ATP-dependent DNA helicase RecG
MAKLGIETLYDLVSFFPRAYEDRTVTKPISLLIPGETACVRGVVAAPPRLSHVRRGLDLVNCVSWTRLVPEHHLF